MKISIIVILIILCSSGKIFSFENRLSIVKDDSCKIVYEKITEQLIKEPNGFYQKFSNQTFLGSTPGVKTVTEVWLDGDNGIFKNDLVTIFNKGREQMMIFHNSGKIIIKLAEKDEVSNSGSALQYGSYDTIVKYGTISCTKANGFYTMVVGFPKKVNGKDNNIKQLTYRIKESGFEIKKLKVEYYGEENQIDIYDYLSQSSNLKNADLKLTFEQYIYDKQNKLKKDFTGFTIQDIRYKNSIK